ncbi:PAS domain-containing protein [Cytophagaceae bacterium YF14B1]|uniref:histidine kinase n=1 Tax=Xanthocytophaga flava TaxID=3048013 RepID=A0AAE3QVJ3_9BACT|nr:PAS domain-containing protein [Xanthocytophaga flavus]MDJ1486165.1 PAS domain-containing protein [Xanthocytophaga flavus]
MSVRDQQLREHIISYGSFSRDISEIRGMYNSMRGDFGFAFIISSETDPVNSAKLVDWFTSRNQSLVSFIQRLKGYTDLPVNLLQQRDSFLISLEHFQQLNQSKFDKVLSVTAADSNTTNFVELKSFLFDRYTTSFQELADQSNKLELALSRQNEILIKEADQQSKQILLLSAIFIVLSIVGIVFFFRIITQSIVQPVHNAKDCLQRLSLGEIPSIHMVHGKDEISDMLRALLVLLDNQKRLVRFTEAVAQENFGVEADMFGGNGPVVASLIRMRNSLEESAVQNANKNWYNEGISKLSLILRKKEEDLNQMAFSVLRFLVKYVGANQGSFFIINSSDSEQELVSAATYAYDRQKFGHTRIQWGEGLLGAACLEKQMIYMTEIPQGYTQITSGLGEATPSCLIILPLLYENQVEGAIELALFETLNEHQVNFLNDASNVIASELNGVRTNLKIRLLLQQTQQQTEELKATEEEIRQNMEELSSTQDEMSRQQKQNNELLQRFDLAAKTTTEGLWDMRVPANLEFTDETHFEWTDNFRRMLGYVSVSDFPNKLGSWSNLLHPDDKERTLTAFSAHLLDFTGKTPYDIKYQVKTRTADYRWFRAVGNTLRDETGKPLRVAGTLIDIQEQVDLLGLSAAIDSTLAVAEISHEGIILSANQNFLNLLDYQLNEIRGCHHSSLVESEYSRSLNYSDFWKSLKKGISQVGKLVRITHSGEEKWISVVYSPVFDFQGKLVKVIAFSPMLHSFEN